jgi:hypothetical protein
MVVPTATVIFGRWAFHKEIPSSRVKHSIASRPSRLIVMWEFRRCECRASSREFNLSGPKPGKWTEGYSRQQSSRACGFQTMCLPINVQNVLHSRGKLFEICSGDLKDPSV